MMIPFQSVPRYYLQSLLKFPIPSPLVLDQVGAVAAVLKIPFERLICLLAPIAICPVSMAIWLLVPITICWLVPIAICRLAFIVI